jgi:hypothetical protein
MAICSKAFEEGINAYRDGKWLIDNPYYPYDENYDEWVKGFRYEEDRTGG